jgi:hypothetical protein
MRFRRRKNRALSALPPATLGGSGTVPPKARRHRGIYLLPNLFTLAALFSGFYAIVQAMNQRFELAALAIFAAMVLDGMDGRVARLSYTQSAFGEQFDSLSDMTSFGVRHVRMDSFGPGALGLGRGLRLLRWRSTTPGALQRQPRRGRQALLPGAAKSRRGGADRRVCVAGDRQQVPHS